MENKKEAWINDAKFLNDLLLPNDRDYFIDSNNDIYQVIGYIHPENKVYCLKKYDAVSVNKEDIGNKIGDNNPNANDSYKQNKGGDFVGNGTKPFLWFSHLNDTYYKRVILGYSSQTADKNIKSNKYKEFSEIYGADFIAYPHEEIKYYLQPRKKANLLISRYSMNNLDSLIKYSPQRLSAIEFIFQLEDDLGISPDDVGITGSILWDGEHKYSDIDIIIYGLNNTKRFIFSNNSLNLKPNFLRRLTTTEIFNIANRFAIKTGLSFDDCVVYTFKKPYLFYIGKYFLSIAFAPYDSEIRRNPMADKDTRFKNVKGAEDVTIRAVVKGEDWGYFYPGLVEIEDIKTIEFEPQNIKDKLLKDNPSLIKRIIIFERECSGYFHEGDHLEIRGLIQRVENPPIDNNTHDNSFGSYQISGNTKNNNTNNNNTNNSGIDNKDSVNKENVFYQIVIGTYENYGNEYIKNLDI
ncbi:MAG: hypothetical protein ACTSVC_15175 [Promethearchaeota archaeon]